VVREGEASISQVARDFGISESRLQRWLKIANRDDGLAPPRSGDRGGGSKDESAELGSCAGATNSWSRRTRSPTGTSTTSKRPVKGFQSAGKRWKLLPMPEVDA
jgi:transposase